MLTVVTITLLTDGPTTVLPEIKTISGSSPAGFMGIDIPHLVILMGISRFKCLPYLSVREYSRFANHTKKGTLQLCTSHSLCPGIITIRYLCSKGNRESKQNNQSKTVVTALVHFLMTFSTRVRLPGEKANIKKTMLSDL
jgi:hypothetical protein